MIGYKRIFTLPFKFNVPNYALIFINNNSFIKIYLKYLKRFIYIFFKRQTPKNKKSKAKAVPGVYETKEIHHQLAMQHAT